RNRVCLESHADRPPPRVGVSALPGAKRRWHPQSALRLERLAMAKRREPVLWIKLRFGDDDEVGPGKIALLRRIEEQRSISGAARAMNMSYRRAWLLIDELNRQC